MNITPEQSSSVKVVRGLLGWSNKRSGLEFYRYDEKVIPRHGSEWGELLVSELGPNEGREYEGCPVVVTVLDRRASSDDVTAEASAAARCAACGHSWSRHDPEDGQCDGGGPAIGHAGLGPCPCGRDLAYTQSRNADLCRKALG